MYAWGWTLDKIELAAKMAALRIGNGTELTLEGVGSKGRATTFVLRFRSSTKRLLKRERVNGAEYPPGVKVGEGHCKIARIVDPIPASELFFGDPRVRTESVLFRRSCGAPCWHGFGHFLRCMFEINPEGRIKTALADYRGASGFEETYRTTNRNIGSMMHPLQYADACDCHHYGVEEF